MVGTSAEDKPGGENLFSKGFYFTTTTWLKSSRKLVKTGFCNKVRHMSVKNLCHNNVNVKFKTPEIAITAPEKN